jgi:hypothetical protein
MNFCRIATVSCVFLLALQSARAETPDSKERAARKACLLGDVTKGTEILADLYLDTKDPTHIYNQGRCFEQNGQNEPAILRFREYLRKAEHLPAADVAKVEKKIAELQEKDKGRNAAPAAPPPVPIPGTPTTTLPPAAAGTPAANQPLPPPAAAPVVTATTDPLQISQPSPAPQATSTPVYKRWWFWGGIGAVVAGAAVATVLLMSPSGAKHSPPCISGAICVQ